MKVWLYAIGLSLGLTAFIAHADAQPRLTASFLPQSRSTENPESATYFATLINYGNETATNCMARYLADYDIVGVELHYFLLDSQQAIVGGADPEFDLAAGASQNLLIEQRPIPGGAVYAVTTHWERIGFVCDQAGFTGFEENGRLLAHFHEGDRADIIAVGSTLSGDQIMRAPGPGRRAVMAIAAVNIGASERVGITGWSAQYPIANRWGRSEVEITVCETDAQARCLADPVGELNFDFESGEVRTFNVYARTDEPVGVPLQPAYNRVHVSIEPVNPVTGTVVFTRRTSTSAAFYSPAEAEPPVAGIWTFIANAEFDVANARRGGAHEGEILVIPRGGEWADRGPIVITDVMEDAPGGEFTPTLRTEIAWDDVSVQDRVITFTPYVEVGAGNDIVPGYVFRYPAGTPPSGNLNFRPGSAGGGVVSGRWRQFARHEGCGAYCTQEDDRLNWTYEIAGLRERVNNSFDWSDLPVSWRESDIENHVSNRVLTIHADGRFEGVGHFYLTNQGNYRECTFSGQLYDTAPGSAAFYFRMTVNNDAACQSGGHPPLYPYMYGEYEGVLRITRSSAPVHDHYKFFLRGMNFPGLGLDYSYYNTMTISVPIED